MPESDESSASSSKPSGSSRMNVESLSSVDSEPWTLSESEKSIGSEGGTASGNVAGTWAIVDDALLGAKSSGVKTKRLTG